MTRWSPWRSVLAAAVLGFLEAAGSPEERRLLRVPPVVRFSDRLPRPTRPDRLWFLAPLTDWRRYLHRN